MEHIFAALWQPFEHIYVRQEEGHIYASQLFHSVDLKRVLTMCMCTFNNHLLMLEKNGGFLSTGWSPPHTCSFLDPGAWTTIRIFLSDRVVTNKGNELGVFLESDSDNFIGPRKSYVWLRYKHDLSKLFIRLWECVKVMVHGSMFVLFMNGLSIFISFVASFTIRRDFVVNFWNLEMVLWTIWSWNGPESCKLSRSAKPW